MTISADNTAKLQEALRYIQSHSNQTIASTLRYAAAQVLRTLSASSRIRVAKKMPPSKSLKKVKGSTVLQTVKFKQPRSIMPNGNYYIFETDYGKTYQNFAYHIVPNQTVAKRSLLSLFQRKRAGLARDTLRYGLSKMGESGGGYQSLANKFVTVTYKGDFNQPPKTGDNEFAITFTDKLRYMFSALKDPNALDGAVNVAAEQMVQKFNHSTSKLAEKFNSENN